MLRHINIVGEEVTRFKSDECVVNSTSAKIPPLSITPTDAYIAEILPDGRKHYTAVNDESKLGETITKSLNVTEVSGYNKAEFLEHIQSVFVQSGSKTFCGRRIVRQ